MDFSVLPKVGQFIETNVYIYVCIYIYVYILTYVLGLYRFTYMVDNILASV
jgi:hypothetical protein